MLSAIESEEEDWRAELSRIHVQKLVISWDSAVMLAVPPRVLVPLPCCANSFRADRSPCGCDLRI